MRQRGFTSPTPPAIIKLTNKRHGEGITRMYDFVIIGGIVGMSTAMQLIESLSRMRASRLLEKESAPACLNRAITAA